MAYIGRSVDKISNIETLDNITFDGSSSYSLTKNSVGFSPSASQNILLSIDGVVQSGNFTVSGSTIDFGVAISSSSVCNFIIHLGVGIVTSPSDGSVTTAKIQDDAVTKDKVSNLMYPAFEARLSADQSVADAVATKGEFDTEVLDTDNCYDNTTNYRFTPTVAGKYFVYGCINNDSQGNSQLGYGQTYIYKNGSSYRKTETYFSSSNVRRSSIFTTAIIDMNGTTDYLELYGNANDTSGTPLFRGANNESFFGAYRIGD